MTKILATLAALTFTLTACNSGGDDDGGGDSTAMPRVEALMDRADCRGSVRPAGEEEFYAAETGDCDLGGRDVTISVYPSDTARDQAAEMARSAGGVIVLGDRWAAWTTWPETGESLAEALDGETE